MIINNHSDLTYNIFQREMINLKVYLLMEEGYVDQDPIAIFMSKELGEQYMDKFSRQRAKLDANYNYYLLESELIDTLPHNELNYDSNFKDVLSL